MRTPHPLLLAVSYIVAVGGCTPAPDPIAIDCRSLPSAGAAAAETLTVVVRIDHHSARRGARFLVRVDPLSEPGAVVFEEGTPPTAAAAAVALTTSGTFQGCLASAPSGFELRASEAPLGRVWLRVSSNVPVIARLLVGGGQGDPPREGTTVTVRPGASGQATAERALAGEDPVAGAPRLGP